MKISITALAAVWAADVMARSNVGSSDANSITLPFITPTPTASAVAARRDALTSTMSDFPGTPMCDQTMVITVGIHTTVVIPVPCSDLTSSTASPSASQTPYDFTGTTWSLSTLTTTSREVAFPTPTFDESARAYPTSMFPKSKTSSTSTSSASRVFEAMREAAMHNHQIPTAASSSSADRVCGSTKISLTRGIHRTVWMPLPCSAPAGAVEPSAVCGSTKISLTRGVHTTVWMPLPCPASAAAETTSAMCFGLVTPTAGVLTVLTTPYPCHKPGALHPMTFPAPSREWGAVADRTSFLTVVRGTEAA